MVTFEICRIHQRQQDFRNAYSTMAKLLKVTVNHLNPGLEIPSEPLRAVKDGPVVP